MSREAAKDCPGDNEEDYETQIKTLNQKLMLQNYCL